MPETFGEQAVKEPDLVRLVLQASGASLPGKIRLRSIDAGHDAGFSF